MGCCQKYDPFLGTLNIRGRIIIGIQKRDHDFDNHPYLLGLSLDLRPLALWDSLIFLLKVPKG